MISCACFSSTEITSHFELNEEQKTWKDAQYRCRLYGKFLASIHSKSEEEEIKNLLKNKESQSTYWIGLNDRMQEAVYRWSDYSILKFKSLAPRSKLFNSDLDCVEINKTVTNSWRDADCSVKKGFICRKFKGQGFISLRRV